MQVQLRQVPSSGLFTTALVETWKSSSHTTRATAMAARTYAAQAEMTIREREFMKLHDILQNLGQTKQQNDVATQRSITQRKRLT
jgi:hypothetical protein